MSSIVTPMRLRSAIAETLWDCVKAHHLEAACDALNMAPARDGSPEPFNSKRSYVEGRLQGMPLPALTDLAHRVAAEYDAEHLQPLLDALGAHGVAGELKNLIFAADGPKPRIVLRDAVNNVIDIVENAQYCLVYDRPVAEHGLSWQDLVTWWTEQHPGPGTERDHARELYNRLINSLGDNPVERAVFRTYGRFYGYPGGFDLPALIPQVYLHYDPYTKRQLGDRPGQLERQRMDFLLLMPRRHRIVLEVDGRQHYADSSGAADPIRYSKTMAEDRAVKLAGYEVFRFGAHELTDGDPAALLQVFFRDLLAQYDLSVRSG
jgi:hypothetical protein